MTDPIEPAIKASGFHFDEVDPKSAAEGKELNTRAVMAASPTAAASQQAAAVPKDAASAPLGDLIGFTNQEDPSEPIVFAGNGFNTIFRPQSLKSTAPLPVPVRPATTH
jgi:hypothetical protein